MVVGCCGGTDTSCFFWYGELLSHTSDKVFFESSTAVSTTVDEFPFGSAFQLACVAVRL